MAHFGSFGSACVLGVGTLSGLSLVAPLAVYCLSFIELANVSTFFLHIFTHFYLGISHYVKSGCVFNKTRIFFGDL